MQAVFAVPLPVIVNCTRVVARLLKRLDREHCSAPVSASTSEGSVCARVCNRLRGLGQRRVPWRRTFAGGGANGEEERENPGGCDGRHGLEPSCGTAVTQPETNGLDSTVWPEYASRMPAKMAARTSIRWTPEDKRALDTLRRLTGVGNYVDVIRLAVREAVSARKGR